MPSGVASRFAFGVQNYSASISAPMVRCAYRRAPSSTRCIGPSSPARWAVPSDTRIKSAAYRLSSRSTASPPRTTPARSGFLEPSLAGLLEAIEDGVPVLGYCHWTMLDNFEWVSGYATQLGLHEVDRETFARTAKPSAAEYARLVRSHRARAAGVRDDEDSR